MSKKSIEKSKAKNPAQEIAEALSDVLQPSTVEEITRCKTRGAAIDRACTALFTEKGITNPSQFLVGRGIVKEGIVPELPQETVRIIERITRISREIEEKIDTLGTIHAFISKFHEAVLGRALNWHNGEDKPFEEKQIRAALFESISAYIFDSNQERCDAILKEKEQTEDPVILTVLEFRKRLYERLPEILGQSN